jgi:hypothetical protein
VYFYTRSFSFSKNFIGQGQSPICFHFDLSYNLVRRYLVDGGVICQTHLDLLRLVVCGEDHRTLDVVGLLLLFPPDPIGCFEQLAGNYRAVTTVVWFRHFYVYTRIFTKPEILTFSFKIIK